MKFKDTKNIIPNNGIILYKDTPCIILNYDEGDVYEVAYANVIYKNTQVVLEYVDDWQKISDYYNPTWATLISDLIKYEKTKIFHILETIELYKKFPNSINSINKCKKDIKKYENRIKELELK